MARLDRLGPAAKDVAQTGAAIGREFGYELLASVTDLPEPQLREALDRLTNAGLLFVRGTPPESSYIFKHALVQDAAYGTLAAQPAAAAASTELRRPWKTRFPEIVLRTRRGVGAALRGGGNRSRRCRILAEGGSAGAGRSAMAEASRPVAQGAGLCWPSLPRWSGVRQQELDLQIALGTALMAATKGFRRPRVGESLARARTSG